MKNTNWNNLRAKLHHDWLQNRYLTFLKSRRDCFDNTDACIEDREEVFEQLLQWRDKRELLESFINNTEDALSPRQLLYEPPLDRMSDENKEWLGEVIHALYLTRTGIRNKVVELDAMLVELDGIVEMAEQGLKGERTSKKSSGDKIVSAFTQLSRKISELPHTIQVV